MPGGPPRSAPTSCRCCPRSAWSSGWRSGTTQLTAELDRERDERFRLASLVEGSDDAIVSATLDGTIISWNPGAERLYGYPAHEIVGQDVSMLVPAERTPDRHYLLDRVRAGERIPAFDAVHRRKDGSPVTISLSMSPIHDRHGQVVAVAGIAHDITETRRLESNLRQSAKMEAVGRLAGGLAHDFNNMLTVIDGYSELVLMKLPADSPVRSLVEEIHKAGERAAELTRQLMVFSRKSMVEPRVLDLSEVVLADVDMLKRVIGEDIAIDTRLAADLDHVMADRAQFDQMLVNLVINARDAMPDGGQVTIETANVNFTAAHGVAPREVPPGSYVMLAVSDTGVGMDAAHAQAGVRAVLHHQGQRPRHRPRPDDAAELRDAERWLRRGVQRARPGHDLQDLPPDRGPAGGGDAPAPLGRAPARDRNRPRRGG